MAEPEKTAEETTASGLIVERDKPTVVDVHKSFGSLKGEVFAAMPLRSREPELTPTEVQNRSGEVRVLLERMRVIAYRDKHSQNLNDVHALIFELQLALGEWKSGHTGNRIYLPGEK